LNRRGDHERRERAPALVRAERATPRLLRRTHAASLHPVRAPRPAATNVHLVMHLPFPGADVTGQTWRKPVPMAIDGRTDRTFPHDICLQHYADDLANDLRAALPHRTCSAELPWNNAWLERWNLDVVCLCVVEDIDTASGDWATYRKRIDERRFAIRERATTELGREPLWPCLLHVIEAEAPRAQLDEIAAKLTDNGQSCVLDSFPDVAVRFALDACVAIPPQRIDVAFGVARIMAIHTAIWAAAMQFDRELLPLLSRPNENEQLSELERRADRLRETSRRVRAFRAPLANTAAHLNHLDGPLWLALADRWALEPQLDALCSRTDALQHMHTDLIAAVTSKHAQRLSRIALALALISGCTAIFAIVQFVIVEPKPTEVRIANVAVVTVVAAIAASLWWASFERTHEADSRMPH
jgi:hypothetical protein